MEAQKTTAEPKLTENPWRFPNILIWFSVALVACAISIVIFLIYKYYGLIFQLTPEITAHLGQLGDFFGGILNPVLSFATFAGVIYTIIVNGKIIHQSETRSEEAVNRQTTQLTLLTKQIEILERQSFDSVFFSLLQAHARNLDAIQITDGQTPLSGHNSISYILSAPDIEAIDIPPYPHVGLERSLMESYCHDFLSRHESVLSHYYKTAIQIILYIEKNSSLSGEQIKSYIELYFSTLSSQEIKTIYLFAASKNDEHFLNLFKKYNLIEWLPRGKVLDKLKPYPLY